jgi:hypothetical protein
MFEWQGLDWADIIGYVAIHPSRFSLGPITFIDRYNFDFETESLSNQINLFLLAEHLLGIGVSILSTLQTKHVFAPAA